jgi:hypothetical protein
LFLRHAIDEDLDKLEDLLKKIRMLKQFKEVRRGIFYLKSIAFLHFHEDAGKFFADIKVKNNFEHFPVNTMDEKKFLLSKIDSVLIRMHK